MTKMKDKINHNRPKVLKGSSKTVVEVTSKEWCSFTERIRKRKQSRFKTDATTTIKRMHKTEAHICICKLRISLKSSHVNCLLLISLLGVLSPVKALINGVTPLLGPDTRGERLIRTPITTPQAGKALIGYPNNIDNMASMLMKSEHGSGSQTTKRSLSDRPVPLASSLTTIPPPLLTTLRYSDKFPHQSQSNSHHRNYELDLERDHALPTSAPNADILKSNSNPTYPNPNRHGHTHDRERHRHLLNSTPNISNLPNSLKKNSNGQPNGSEIPSYSPPARAFFTPPLPPEYQNPFADKPTLRGTHNEGLVPANVGSSSNSQSSYINRRPIPPPSLMPGHERIPLRPPDAPSIPNSNNDSNKNGVSAPISPAIITPSTAKSDSPKKSSSELQSSEANVDSALDTKQEILPNIRRILSGANGNKGEIPEVLLKQVTLRPLLSSHQPPSSPVVLLDSSLRNEHDLELNGGVNTNIGSNINHQKTEAADTKLMQNEQFEPNNGINGADNFPKHMGSVAAKSENQATIAAATATSSSTTVGVDRELLPKSNSSAGSVSSDSTSSSSTSSSHSTWNIAWNVHVYLSVILFTILAVYSFYKILTYNKLTHLFPQSYFLCIHLVLIIICTSRIFYLCYDAYNIHGSFQIFVSELLLNLPATLLTISFSVLMLFLFRKSLNHKHNRYSALIRPLTVIVGCGVHVVLCITLHYVESYTMQNYFQQQQQLHHQQQQQMYYQQQLQRHRQQGQQQQPQSLSYNMHFMAATTTTPPPPPRVLSLICQIIYIFVCLSLGLLYLYLYRILKRILRSKSQNYIHGYQNLSYAIHITIATALLFVLLAILQIFGAIGIAAKRPLTAVVEIDWLQWGYQFSLRLIEVAIITLISWVAGLKTKSGSGGAPSMPVGGTIGNGGLGQSSGRDKFGNQRSHHGSGVGGGGFFLPCTSTSSQEQFETDYPAVCSANTNLHTYTMRTGKLIYDDSFALNALGQSHHSNSNYQRPYDTNSLRSAGVKYQQRYPQHHQHHHHYATTDYLTDATTDHYENPNFDLQTTTNPAMKFTKTDSSATSTTTASSKSGGGATSGASSQQQMLLLQSESCYSEPNYDFNNFERPKFGSHANQNQRANQRPIITSQENPDRRSNSNSCASSGSSVNFTTYGGGERRSGKRFATYNSFERGGSRHANGVRKSGTLNNILNGGKQPIPNGSSNEHQLAAEICYRTEIGSAQPPADQDFGYERPPTLERSNSRTPLQVHHLYTHPPSTEDDKTHLTDDTTTLAEVTLQPTAN